MEGLRGRQLPYACYRCKMAKGEFRCEECIGGELYCGECISMLHQAIPLHRIKVRISPYSLADSVVPNDLHSAGQGRFFDTLALPKRALSSPSVMTGIHVYLPPHRRALPLSTYLASMSFVYATVDVERELHHSIGGRSVVQAGGRLRCNVQRPRSRYERCASMRF